MSNLQQLFHDFFFLGSVILAVCHGLGLLSAIHAVMNCRTSQGTIAWVLTMLLWPYLFVPAYWIFGRSKFFGYVDARREGDKQIHHIAESLAEHSPRFGAEKVGADADFRLLETLAKMPFTRHNGVRLLVDGAATFGAIFEGIDAARHYILVQFFIVHDDELGRELKTKLIARARAGVRVYFLYDGVGSHSLPSAYLAELEEAGIETQPFGRVRGFWNLLRLNFRNHRKIVVVDGKTAYVGGLNVGDEYMGRDPKFGPWRDTHLELMGPAVQCVQLAFIEDWHWAAGSVPELNWTPEPSASGNADVLVLPSGPADEFETCGLFYVHAINSARRRVWISSPYFVPDPQVICALQLAALRGVDVRVILPEKADHRLVYWSGFSFVAETEAYGVQIYRYQPGFVHQKVILIDDEAAAVGTANLDNRSFRLNFEIMIVVAEKSFALAVHRMLDADFANCRRARAGDAGSRHLLFPLLVRIGRLLAPIQ